MRTLSDLDLQDASVLVRLDLNVPLADGQITDDGRIRAALPTLKELLDAGAKPVVVAHLGRPKGEVKADLSLAPVATRMAELLGVPVDLAPAGAILPGTPGRVVLLENIRFDARETSKDPAERAALAAELANGMDAYVSDGFGVLHREQASVTDVAKLLPNAAGRLVEKEIRSFAAVLTDPARPYTVVLGGSKVSDKLGVIDNLLQSVDRLVIGGGMCFTFLAAQGHRIGDSLFEADWVDRCREILAGAEERDVTVMLPTDVVIAQDLDADASSPGRIGGRRHPGWLEGFGHRSADGSGLRPSRTRLGHGGVERSDGGVRTGTVRGRHPGCGTSAGRDRGLHGRRRRGFRGSGPPAGHRRRCDRPHLHRWRRKSGTTRRQDLAGNRCTGGRMSRKPLMAGNWKMHLNHLEAIALVQKVAFLLKDEDYAACDAAVLPPFTDLRSVQTLVEGDKLKIQYGAQDVSEHAAGAYTGEVAAHMLAKLGCTYVTVGHSERRTYHHETDEVVNTKAKAALDNGLIPIVCVGEHLDVRQAGNHVEHVREQLVGSLAGLSEEQMLSVVIAYEPVWAIGTGEVASPEDAQEVCGVIREWIEQHHGTGVAEQIRILYGGSVKSTNIAGIMAKPDVDGALIGGASLDAEEFASIVRHRLHPQVAS